MDNLSRMDWIAGYDILTDMLCDLAKVSENNDEPASQSELMRRVFYHVLSLPEEEFLKVVEETKLIKS